MTVVSNLNPDHLEGIALELSSVGNDLASIAAVFSLPPRQVHINTALSVFSSGEGKKNRERRPRGTIDKVTRDAGMGVGGGAGLLQEIDHDI